jgi:hypothetical protein
MLYAIVRAVSLLGCIVIISKLLRQFQARLAETVNVWDDVLIASVASGRYPHQKEKNAKVG